jgi:hypothetical protein
MDPVGLVARILAGNFGGRGMKKPFVPIALGAIVLVAAVGALVAGDVGPFAAAPSPAGSSGPTQAASSAAPGSPAPIGPSPAPPVASSSPTALSPSRPVGGLTLDEAVAKVRGYELTAGSSVDPNEVPTIGALDSAEAVQAGTRLSDTELLAADSTADRWVWILLFEATSGPICPPDGSACMPSRHGTLRIVLDYFSGDFLQSSGSFPAG